MLCRLCLCQGLKCFYETAAADEIDNMQCVIGGYGSGWRASRMGLTQQLH